MFAALVLSSVSCLDSLDDGLYSVHRTNLSLPGMLLISVCIPAMKGKQGQVGRWKREPEQVVSKVLEAHM